MEQTDEHEEIPLSAIVMFVALLSACAVVPWILHFTVGWWAGILSWIGLVTLYDMLFVPKGSLCMGIPFLIPMGSFLLLLLHNLVDLTRWAF